MTNKCVQSLDSALSSRIKSLSGRGYGGIHYWDISLHGFLYQNFINRIKNL